MLKWIILSTILLVFFGFTLFSAKRQGGILKRLLIVLKMNWGILIFSVVTIALYIPASLFLSNISDLYVSFWKIVGWLLLVSLIYFTLCFSLLIIAGKHDNFFASLIFAITLCVYVQSNFLNFHMPILDGSSFDFFEYKGDILLSLLIWIVLTGVLLLLYFKKNTLSKKLFRYTSYLFTAMQIISLISLIILNSNTSSMNVCLDKGILSAGSKSNTMLLVVDSLDGKGLSKYFKSNPSEKEKFSDFTFYDRCVGGGAPTALGIPALLTGSEYDAVEDFDEFTTNAWEDTSLYSDMKTDGYDVRFFCVPGNLSNLPPSYTNNMFPADNMYCLESPLRFIRNLYELSLMYELPQMIKTPFIKDTSSFEECIGIEGNASIFHTESNIFKNKIEEKNQIDVSYAKSFRYFHFYGMHQPYRQDENLEYLYDSSYEQVLCGNLNMLYEYLLLLKDAGIYDQSRIIICGDHGTEGDNAAESLKMNPAVLIKEANTRRSELELCHTIITLRNVYSTMAEWFYDNGMNGPTVADISDSSDQECLHTVTDAMVEYYGQSTGGFVRVIPSSPWGRNSDSPQWNPYEINKLACSLGESIDVSKENGILTRIYYDVSGINVETGGFLSNEFTACMCFPARIKEDITLSLSIPYLFGEKQKVIISANGHRLDEAELVSSQPKNFNGIYENRSPEVKITIPQKFINTDTIYLRLVMPNAVTPHMIDENNSDDRVYSVLLQNISLE